MAKRKRSCSYDGGGNLPVSERYSPNKGKLPSSTPATVQDESPLRRPADEDVIGLFERMHQRRPEFTFLAGDMRMTLKTQLTWNMEINRVMKLWEKVIHQKPRPPLQLGNILPMNTKPTRRTDLRATP